MKKPAVQKGWLFVLAGMIWTGVGILLNAIAYGWLIRFNGATLTMVLSIGILGGVIITLFGFSKIALKNILRIKRYTDPVCVFAFQEWKSYILVIVMIGLGIFLRHTTFLPREIVAVIYISIGLALFLSSFLYYKNFRQRTS